MSIDYQTCSASSEEILSHLRQCSDSFYPPLAERVELTDYAKKLCEKSITFEAWQGEHLVGMVAAYLNNEKDRLGFITSVSVDKRFNGQGIGTSLMQLCIREAESRKLNQLSLEVSVKSSDAVNLYTRMGFVISGNSGDYAIMKKYLQVL